ncbi:hypothetical protein NVP1077O_52 [Vibrio phage 1.077.O._10N.261.45.A10]|nr:hypothetical protein NVP1077O_52 [Vibrio phage 1.077.O._10N.261.45.A10]
MFVRYSITCPKCGLHHLYQCCPNCGTSKEKRDG